MTDAAKLPPCRCGFGDCSACIDQFCLCERHARRKAADAFDDMMRMRLFDPMKNSITTHGCPDLGEPFPPLTTIQSDYALPIFRHATRTWMIPFQAHTGVVEVPVRFCPLCGQRLSEEP